MINRPAPTTYSPVATDSPTRQNIVVYKMTRTRRKWQIYPGKNKFCCDGRIITSKQPGVFYLTCGLIVVTSGLFFGFDCPYLSKRLTPAIPVIAAVIMVFVMSVLCRTSLSDPGILPRATIDEAADLERQIGVPNEEAGTSSYRPPPRIKEVLIKGQTVKLKYCFSCKIFRPPRSSHCSVCDNCVERFDHHCPWVGNCVGIRNYRYFYLFLLSTSVYCVYMFACVLAHLILESLESDFLSAMKNDPVSMAGGIVVGAVCFFSVWSVVGLCGFHSYLTASEMTTNEDIKGSFATKRGEKNYNPYNRGNLFSNCGFVLCGPLPPSLIDRRGFVIDDLLQEQTNEHYQQSGDNHWQTNTNGNGQVNANGWLSNNSQLNGNNSRPDILFQASGYTSGGRIDYSGE